MNISCHFYSNGVAQRLDSLALLKVLKPSCGALLAELDKLDKVNRVN